VFPTESKPKNSGGVLKPSGTTPKPTNNTPKPTNNTPIKTTPVIKPGKG